jgi:hypothetical protein
MMTTGFGWVVSEKTGKLPSGGELEKKEISSWTETEVTPLRGPLELK